MIHLGVDDQREQLGVTGGFLVLLGNLAEFSTLEHHPVPALRREPAAVEGLGPDIDARVLRFDPVDLPVHVVFRQAADDSGRNQHYQGKKNQQCNQPPLHGVPSELWKVAPC